MKLRRTQKAKSLTVIVRAPAEHLGDDAYLDRMDPLMRALLDLERANPEHFADPGIACQAGPTAADRFVDVVALVIVEPDHVWARVPSLPGCFATGSTLEELREALAEAVTMCATGA